MSHPVAPPPQIGASLGPALQDAIVEACRGRLSDIRWFRSDWQRGGGSTGSGVFHTRDGPVEVVIKLPIGPVEFRWTTALSQATVNGSPRRLPALADRLLDEDLGAPTPRVLAADKTLGGYDLGWIVIEKLPGLPLGARLDARGIEDMLCAVVELHVRAAAAMPLGPQPAGPPWEKLLQKSRDVIHHGKLPEAQRWNNIVHDVQKHLPQLLRRWNARPINTWCHGDLHPGNAMRRATACTLEDGARPAAGVDHLGPCVLLDLALVHAGHWVEDALYFERVYWGHSDMLRGVNLVSVLARIRRERGFADHEDYGMLANVRRVLTAAAAPGMLEREGNPRYLKYALELIPKLLPMVGK